MNLHIILTVLVARIIDFESELKAHFTELQVLNNKIEKFDFFSSVGEMGPLKFREDLRVELKSEKFNIHGTHLKFLLSLDIRVKNLNMLNAFKGMSEGFRVIIKTRSGLTIFKSEITDNIVNGNELIIEEQELEVDISYANLSLQFIVEEFVKESSGKKSKRGEDHEVKRQVISSINIDLFEEFFKLHHK